MLALAVAVALAIDVGRKCRRNRQRQRHASRLHDEHVKAARRRERAHLTHEVITDGAADAAVGECDELLVAVDTDRVREEHAVDVDVCGGATEGGG
eukprot:354764-Chlamydomonas_euryale.AAC.1